MKIILFFVTFLIWTGICCTGTVCGSGTDLQERLNGQISQVTPDYSPDTILVQFHDADYTSSSAARVHAPVSARVLREYSPLGMAGLELVSPGEGVSPEYALSYYRSLPSVRYAEPNYYRFFDRLPDDPDLWREWPLQNTGQVFREGTPPGIPGADIHAPLAWNTTTDGRNIVIGLIDTGVDYHHPDLAKNLWRDPATGSYGYDTITGRLDPMDLFGHGTHCAGIIGAVGNNSLGTSGVNWQAQIMTVSLSGSLGSSTVADSVTGILWASQHGAKIVSCSYGGPYFSQAEYDAIARSGALVVCSAGNSGEDLEFHPHYPASYNLSTIIAVAATDANDTLAEFSCFGNRSVDLGAPGVDVYSSIRSVYDPPAVWRESISSFENWTTVGNWTINPGSSTTPHSGALGTIDTTLHSSSLPLTLSLAKPVNLSGIHNPVISYEWQPVGSNYSYSVEMSSNGKIWRQVDSFEFFLIFIPSPLSRMCKVPVDMQGGPLYIRFNANGSVCSQVIQDVTLSDGYGDPITARYSYQNGTSMACPQVSGIAGLLASTFPDASPDLIKTSILSTTDPARSLQGKTVTGGRVNLTAALRFLESGQERIPLNPGWNHISFSHRLKQGNDTAGQVFAPLTDTSGHSVLFYEGSGWRMVQSDEEIKPLSSYWIWTGSPVSLHPSADPDQNGTYSRDLVSGWNGFGRVQTAERSARDELVSINESWTYLIGYNSTFQRYESPIINGGTGNSSDTRLMIPDQGYWLYVQQNCTYHRTA